jgi:hypothetical protein
MQFGGDGVAQLVSALLDLGEAFALELSGDVSQAARARPRSQIVLVASSASEMAVRYQVSRVWADRIQVGKGPARSGNMG